MFSTTKQFLDYIFSVKYEGREYDVLPFKTGEYCLTDLFRYLKDFTEEEKLQLRSDIHFYIERLVIEETEREYPRDRYPSELFGYLYEERTEEVNLYRSLQDYNLAFWAYEYLTSCLKKNNVVETSRTNSGLTPEWWGQYPEIDTPEARKYFKRCEDQGWLTITSTGGEWKLQAVRLGYVCNRIYAHPRPLTALIKVFNNPNIKAQITQADYEVKTIAAKSWRAEIDSKIFFD